MYNGTLAYTGASISALALVGGFVAAAVLIFAGVALISLAPKFSKKD